MLGSATKLQTARQINGTNFDGTGNVTTSKWGTARTIALSGAVTGSASVDGSGNVTISTTNPNIAVINNITQNATATAVNYPTGFNQSNCRIIALEWKTSTMNNWRNASCIVDGSSVSPVYADLASNNIQIYDSYHRVHSSEYTTTFRLVLMKV